MHELKANINSFEEKDIRTVSNFRGIKMNLILLCILLSIFIFNVVEAGGESRKNFNLVYVSSHNIV